MTPLGKAQQQDPLTESSGVWRGKRVDVQQTKGEQGFEILTASAEGPGLVSS